MGKTTVAEKLCRHYKIHHIKINEVTEERITQLVSGINEGDQLCMISNKEKMYAAPLWRFFAHSSRSWEINTVQFEFVKFSSLYFIERDC